MKPRATYRLQFNRDFPFVAAARLAGYFRDLGVSHIYASPILTARAGSIHGYDVVDHARINPELGGEEGFLALASTLRDHGLGLIVDIVPNHVAVGNADNRWWLDLLRNGRASRYADYFDIDWDTPGLESKVFAPFLGDAPEWSWNKGELRLARDEADELSFAYFQHRFPLRPEDQNLEVAGLTREQAMSVLDRQHFVLADWREADRKINWRRFFDITELAAIRVLEPKVFEATHGKILALYGQGLIDGVRVDHVDGISDPAAYCRMLRSHMEALRPGGYLVIEKILAVSETLAASWQVDGTTGYDFMNDVSAVLHRPDQGRMERLWQREGARERSFETEETEAREEMLATKFASQLDGTVRAFQPLIPNDTGRSIQAALIAIIAALRCYRCYATGKAGSPGPNNFLLEALMRARRANPALEATLCAVEALFDRTDGDPNVVDALRRFSQLSAPVAAKAVEDTTFYRYGRLLSRNDVGFDPGQHRLSVQDFHSRMQDRLRSGPAAMLAVSTHDHKRGADTRARLASLPAHADQWDRLVRSAPRPEMIRPGDAYQLYQTILGAWPGGMGDEFVARIGAWCVKYLREAKLRSSWDNPNLPYERAFCEFSGDLLCGVRWAAWRGEFEVLLRMLAPETRRNQIAQTVLHLTVPGVPDIYQGCEFEDLSLVDPDNRRPVDYAERIRSLASGASWKQGIIAKLLSTRREHPDLWRLGNYEPLAVPGLANDVLAFSRRHDGLKLFIICQLAEVDEDHPVSLDRDSIDLLGGRSVATGQYTLKSLLADFPAAVLLG